MCSFWFWCWWYIIQGFYSTLTEPVGQTGYQIEERMHPELKQPLKELCSDPKTTVIVLSGSNKTVLEEVKFHIAFILFLSNFYPLIICNYFRILGSMTCGWPQRMGCFYALQRENGWQQCLSVRIWNGLTVRRCSYLSFNSGNCSACFQHVLKLLANTVLFRMFSSILQKEHLAHILKNKKLLLSGITNMQVLLKVIFRGLY